MRAFAGLALAGVLVAGCGSKPLQDLDASGGGVGAIDGGGTGVGDGGVADGPGGGGTTDGAVVQPPPWNVTFSGRRSFNVTSRVQTGAGAAGEISHAFTMTLDTDQRVAIIGANGGVDVYPVEQTAAGPLHVVGDLRLGVAAAAVCGASLTYLDLGFTIDSSGQLSGSGSGTLTTYDTDVVNSVAATMALTGVLDTQPPTFSLSAAGELADPWTGLWVVSSEPLPGQQIRPALRSVGGDLMQFQAPTGMERFVTVLAKPARMLRYSDEYRVTFDGITDLAGNAPTSTVSSSFTTRAPPPLAPADGFESVTDTTLGGAQVLSAADAPTIAGARSLYLPPVPSIGTPGPLPQLALRVSILPGDTVLRFDYRSVNPGDMTGVYFIVASVGGTIGTATLPPDPVGIPTLATIGQTQVSLGPTMTGTIGLPADARDEVVLVRIASQGTSCGGPAPPPVPGMILDNLRAE